MMKQSPGGRPNKPTSRGINACRTLPTTSPPLVQDLPLTT